MRHIIILTAGLSVLIHSCTMKKGYLLFKVTPEEIIATPATKDFIRSHPNPSIVLKVPSTERYSTQSDPNSYIYNAIEKELSLGGFQVKDRGLFNEVIGKSKDISYSDLKNISGTDLLLELVQVSTSVKFETNKFYSPEGRLKLSPVHTFTKYGAIIEFKLTLIDNNQYGGSYLFSYTPCDKIDKQNCECEVAFKRTATVFPYYSFCNKPQNKNLKPFENVSQDVMSKFVRDGVRKLIAEMRK